MSTEFKKFDTSDKYTACGVRLAKDPQVFNGEYGKTVCLTFASESRREKHATLWVQANLEGFIAEKAAFLKKGDVLHKVEGKPVMRPWGEGGEKLSFELVRTDITIPLDLEATLKERGYVRTEGKPGGKPAAKKFPMKGKPVARKVVDIDDDLDDE